MKKRARAGLGRAAGWPLYRTIIQDIESVGSHIKLFYCPLVATANQNQNNDRRSVGHPGHPPSGRTAGGLIPETGSQGKYAGIKNKKSVDIEEPWKNIARSFCDREGENK
jgi:hypothetical protein